MPDDPTAVLLKEAGHKLTPQRMLIVSACRKAPGHLSAADILAEVRRQFAYVDGSTVYRTLTVLKDLRLVSETDIGEGETVYEWIREEPHHHLICKRCGSIEQLEHRYFEDLGSQITSSTGFRPDIDHFAVFGTCNECQ
ncbi:MAG: transcriptional repressor [Dehalococcoidia bacterium]